MRNARSSAGRLAALLFVLVIGGRADIEAEETIDDVIVIVVGSAAPPLDRFAAAELGSLLEELSGAKVRIVTAAPAGASRLMVLGNPRTNAAVETVLTGSWPELSDQGILLRSFDRSGQQGLVIGGGSPVATLWGVYELGYRLGVRYFLSRDVYPPAQRDLRLDRLDVTLEPVLRTRTWRTVNDFSIGPESWGVAEHGTFLGQLAKMKYNRVMLAFHPWQPFVHYACRGVEKQTAMLWSGERYPVDGDTAGKKVFDGQRYFENPDFAGRSSYEEMTEAGVRHARGIIAHARRLGMSVGVSISPLEFPREFLRILPGARVARGLEDPTIAPGRDQSLDDPLLGELVAAKIRACIETYPEIDTLYLTLPELPEWDDDTQAAWDRLDRERGLAGAKLEELIRRSRERRTTASGERGMRSLKGDLVALAFLSTLLERHGGLLRRPDGTNVQLVITAVDPALYPVLDRVVPKGAGALHFVDSTARRVAETIATLEAVPADRVPSQLILTLADDNAGVLPQSAVQSLARLVRVIEARGWDGFSMRYRTPAGLDPSVHFLSRASWDRAVTPRSAHDELWIAATGKESVSTRLWNAFGHAEAATNLIDQHALGFAFPVPGMMLKHFRPEPVPEWWSELAGHYTEMVIELYRAEGAFRGRATEVLFYWAKRGEYAQEYLASVLALREAAIALGDGRQDDAIGRMGSAVESIYNAITSLADVAEGQSDRGLVAVLNAYAYRPLVAEYEDLTR